MLYIYLINLINNTSFCSVEDDKLSKTSAYCGGLILKQTDMKTMLWCSHQPTQEQINELEEKED
jgi:hypothetical protein